MPSAKDGRRSIGTEHCADCDNTAEFYQVKKGGRKGWVYRRCPGSPTGCGADQSVSEAKQRRWLARMTPTGEQMIDHPLGLAIGGDYKEAGSEGDDLKADQTPRAAGVLGLLVLAGAAALALLSA